MKIIIVSILAVAMIGLMVPSVFAEDTKNTIEIFDNLKDTYRINEVIPVSGKVHFPNELGLRECLTVTLEIYGPYNNKLGHLHKDNICNDFKFQIKITKRMADRGFIRDNDIESTQIELVAYYYSTKQVPKEYRDTEYVDKAYVSIIIDKIWDEEIQQWTISDKTATPTIPNTSTPESSTLESSTLESSTPASSPAFDPNVAIGAIVVGIIIIGIIVAIAKRRKKTAIPRTSYKPKPQPPKPTVIIVDGPQKTHRFVCPNCFAPLKRDFVKQTCAHCGWHS